jgi:RNA polymerase sigma-70 factor (ECF subfamily)
LAAPEPVELDSLAANDAGPEVRAELAQLYALLKVMPSDERIAWTLRNVERHRLEEVASLTECSLATVKRRITRAQGFLEEHLGHTHAEASDG